MLNSYIERSCVRLQFTSLFTKYKISITGLMLYDVMDKFQQCVTWFLLEITASI